MSETLPVLPLLEDGFSVLLPDDGFSVLLPDDGFSVLLPDEEVSVLLLLLDGFSVLLPDGFLELEFPLEVSVSFSRSAKEYVISSPSLYK